MNEPQYYIIHTFSILLINTTCNGKILKNIYLRIGQNGGIKMQKNVLHRTDKKGKIQQRLVSNPALVHDFKDVAGSR
jgi:hypothetical protein